MKSEIALVFLGIHSAISLLISSPTTLQNIVASMKFNRGLWPRRRPSVLGLVGGIASGKSTVSKVLTESCGVTVIDADKLGHESYLPGTRCFDRLVEEFGPKIVAGDGTIDRRALGAAVSTFIPIVVVKSTNLQVQTVCQCR